MEIKAKLIKHLPTESGTTKDGKSWSKQSILVSYVSGQFEKKVKFILRGDAAIKAATEAIPGATLNISYEMESREWNDKYFTDNTAWKVVMEEQAF